MNINFEKVEKAWFKSKNRTYWQNKCFERSCEVKLLKEKINELYSDLKTLWTVLWNMDTEMTGYQDEIFDKYYDEFHKRIKKEMK